MSDSWIDWNPRMDEPSKARPSSKTLSSKAETGIEKCCNDTGQVAEPNVDELDVFVFDQFEDVVRRLFRH